ncbi:MAG: aminotransferase, partial [Alphaproteobacteria bacterium]
LKDRLADGLAAQGAALTEKRFRVPHILSIAFPEGMPEGLIEKLAASGAYVAPRLGRVRISPHVYNDEADVDRFLDVWSSI